MIPLVLVTKTKKAMNFISIDWNTTLIAMVSDAGGDVLECIEPSVASARYHPQSPA
jgi:hypothetical protein